MFGVPAQVDAQRRIFYERRQEVLRGDRAFLGDLLGQYAADTARDTLANATKDLAKDANPDAANLASPRPERVSRRERVVPLSRVGLPGTLVPSRGRRQHSPQNLQKVIPRRVSFGRYEFAAKMLQRMYPVCAEEIDASCRLSTDGLADEAAPDAFAVEDALVAGTTEGFRKQVALVDARGEGEDDLPALLMRFYVLREFDNASRPRGFDVGRGGAVALGAATGRAPRRRRDRTSRPAARTIVVAAARPPAEALSTRHPAAGPRPVLDDGTAGDRAASPSTCRRNIHAAGPALDHFAAPRRPFRRPGCST